MENAKSKNRPLIIAILVILSFNLILTAAIFSFFLIGMFAESPTTDSETTGAEPLPGDLATKEHRAQLFAEFKVNYNSGDNEQLLPMFGEAYQLQLRAKDFDESMKVLRSVASIINDGAYEHYEFEMLNTGVAQFYLYYQIDTPEGLRKLKMTLTQQGDSPPELSSIMISF